MNPTEDKLNQSLAELYVMFPLIVDQLLVADGDQSQLPTIYGQYRETTPATTQCINSVKEKKEKEEEKKDYDRFDEGEWRTYLTNNNMSYIEDEEIEMELRHKFRTHIREMLITTRDERALRYWIETVGENVPLNKLKEFYQILVEEQSKLNKEFRLQENKKKCADMSIIEIKAELKSYKAKQSAKTRGELCNRLRYYRNKKI